MPTRQVRRAAQRRAVRALRQRQAAQGLAPRATATIANGTSAWETVAEERQARQEAIDEQVTIYRAVLPEVLTQLAHIKDPRHPKTVRHTTTTLLVYGMLAFVFQMASRREANRQMTMPMFWDNLRLLFPEVETLPHHNILASHTARLAQLVGRLGVRGLIRFLRETCSGPWLAPAHIRAVWAAPCGQIRLE